MISEICEHLHNWFASDSNGNPYPTEVGTFTIADGEINLPFLAVGQYFGIRDSVFNDGVHRYGYDSLVDETFTGTIWAMKVPPSFLALCEEIESWQAKNGEAAAGLYQSESFGGYSYSKASATNSQSALSWKSQFRSRLNQWRKL